MLALNTGTSMTVESVFRELIGNRGYFPGLAVEQAYQMRAELTSAAASPGPGRR